MGGSKKLKAQSLRYGEDWDTPQTLTRRHSHA
jgi:hypothetical protein